MALISYIIRDRHRTYYFRRLIPVALRGFMPEPWTGKANWKKSLGTKDGRVARREAAKCLGACEADFEAAERAMQGKPLAEPPLPAPQPSMTCTAAPSRTVRRQEVVVAVLRAGRDAVARS